MDDLRARFAALDRVPVPDLWIEIATRSTNRTVVTAGTVAWRGASERLPTSRLPIAFAVVGLMLVLTLSAFVAGSLLDRAPQITAPPSDALVGPSPTATLAPTPSPATTPSATPTPSSTTTPVTVTRVICTAEPSQFPGQTLKPVTLLDSSGSVSACRHISGPSDDWSSGGPTERAEVSVQGRAVDVAWIVVGCDEDAEITLERVGTQVAVVIRQLRVEPCAPGTSLTRVRIGLDGEAVEAATFELEHVDQLISAPSQVDCAADQSEFPGETLERITVVDSSGLVIDCRRVATAVDFWVDGGPLAQVAVIEDGLALGVAWIVAGCDGDAEVMVERVGTRSVVVVRQVRIDPCVGGTNLIRLSIGLDDATIDDATIELEHVTDLASVPEE